MVYPAKWCALPSGTPCQMGRLTKCGTVPGEVACQCGTVPGEVAYQMTYPINREFPNFLFCSRCRAAGYRMKKYQNDPPAAGAGSPVASAPARCRAKGSSVPEIRPQGGQGRACQHPAHGPLSRSDRRRHLIWQALRYTGLQCGLEGLFVQKAPVLLRHPHHLPAISAAAVSAGIAVPPPSAP